MLGDGEADSSWSGRLLPAFGEQLLIGDRRHHLAGRVPPAGVVVLDPGRDRGPGLRPVAKCCSDHSSNSRVECHDSMTALSSAEPGRPIDWVTPRRWQAAWNDRA